MSNNTACIVGGAGAVGRLFCELMLTEFAQVKVIDLNCNVDNKVAGVEYITGDISNSETYSHLSESDLIILSLPEAPAIDCIEGLSRVLKAGQCLVETTSVKSLIVSELKALNSAFEILSINPMFGPSLGFQNQSVASIDVNAGVLASEFKHYMESAGASVIDMTAEQHDRSTSITQAATHAAIIAFGMALDKLNYNADEVKPIWTPPHRALMALLARIVAADPEVYRDIQLSNPYAQEARKTLSECLIELDSNVMRDDRSEFAELFKVLKSVLGSNNKELTALCHKMFE